MAMSRPAKREYRTWLMDGCRWNAFEPRRGDIVIATAPKCGTTWMQQIISSLVFQDATIRVLPTVSPWIEVRFHQAEADMHRDLAAQSHRRFVKTHLPIDGLPLYDDVLYIHVARDGRDAAMSLHNHQRSMPPAHFERLDRIGLEDAAVGKPHPRPAADPAEFFRAWLTTPIVEGQSDGSPMLSFFDLEAGYWAERQRPNLLLVHYNDLKHDLDGEMRRISRFLGIKIDETIWTSLVDAARFENMRAAGDQLMPQLKAFLGSSDNFFHKGTNGRWSDILTEDDLAHYARRVQEKFTPGLAAWVAGGRLMAGEPSDSSD